MSCSFPSLNVGVSIDEQLYIKRHPGGIVTLRQDEISQDGSSKKHKTSNKTVQSSSKTASTTDDNDQDSYAKLSKKEKQRVRQIFFWGKQERIIMMTILLTLEQLNDSVLGFIL
jgi:hypothetical protein